MGQFAHFTLDSEFRQSTHFASIDPFRIKFSRAENMRNGSMDSNLLKLSIGNDENRGQFESARIS